MKLDRNHAWLERARRVVPGCAQTFSKGPLNFVAGATPAFLGRGQGARVWDVDGNEYVDYLLGLGPVILGYADTEVNRAAAAQMEAGVSFSLSHPVEVELSELLVSLIPCAEMVRFGKNGSDATAGAVRLSRAVTGRDKVARCGYHGWQDWYIGSTDRWQGVPEAVRALTLSFPYNDPEALDRLFAAHPGAIACVILEPVTFDPPRAGYLEAVRELCHANGALLIFDEVITGFRFGLGGAQTYFGVTPDLACFGKALANGFPLSAIVGKAEFMRRFEDVFFSFTFGGETVSLAAALATIRALRDRGGVASIWDAGERLRRGTQTLIEETGLAGTIECAGYPPWTTLRCPNALPEQALLLRSLFQQECAARGVLTIGAHMISVAHGAGEIDWTLAAYREVFRILAEAQASGAPERWLRGSPMRTILRP
ncbi:MAG: aminotransferase class III-fold pyridoxal phosphate-dependent enzyme [Bryobacterales bacterium]|nr:aminotransferase class III-fold pyridoxal phosphate-dependent enzyme [Bryobacterales bacterium]